jgi:TPR repeat protein
MKRTTFALLSSSILLVLAGCGNHESGQTAGDVPTASGAAASPPQAGATAPAISAAERQYAETMRRVGPGASPAELQQGVNELLTAVEQGNAKAAVALARLYREGRGVPKDAGQAANLLLKAANDGNAEAAFALGTMYRDGDGVQANPGEALNWFFKAASNGHAAAMYELGEAYAGGRGVEANAAEAEAWHAKAKAAGYMAPTTAATGS